MGTRTRILRGALAVAITVVAGFAVGAGPAAAAPRACYKVGDSQYAEFRALVRSYADQGIMTKSVADAVTCDPRTVDKYLTYQVKEEVVASPMWLSGCKESSRWTYVWTLAGVSMGGHVASLQFCWSTATVKVSNWTGECSGYTTGLGGAAGWSWEGCSQNDFIPYTLAGSFPGGVQHATQGHWSNSIQWPTQHKYLDIDMWGHYDGTCDTKLSGEPLRNYC